MQTQALINYTYLPQEIDDKNLRDFIINTLAFTILALGVSLVGYYGDDLSLGEMVKITADLSLSIELIVNSSVSLIAFSILAIQIYRNRFLPPLVGVIAKRSPFLQQMIRSILHLWAFEKYKKEGTETLAANFDNMKKAFTEINPNIKPTIVSYPTRDGVILQGCWQFISTNNPTVICFHSNNSDITGFAQPWGQYYHWLGFNVFLAEYRGYCDAGTAAGRDQELEAYLDAEAAYKYVIEQGIHHRDIMAHGYSLGGAYASALASFFDIETIVLDHTFTTPAAAATSVSRIFAQETIDQGMMHSYSQGTIKADPEFGGRDLVTDGFNSLNKMTNAKHSSLFMIQGTKDTLTPVHFGEQFMRTVYPNDPDLQEQRLAKVQGDHDSIFAFFDKNNAEAPKVQQQFRSFLIQQGLLDSKYLNEPAFLYKIND